MSKDIITLALYVVAAVFAIAATPLPWYTRENTDAQATLWESCTTAGTCTKIKESGTACKDQWDLLGAGRAFTILTILFVAVTAILAALRWQMTTVSVALKMTALKYVYWGVAFFGLICSVLAWIILFALFAADVCGTGKYSDITGFKAGAAGPVAFIGFVFLLIGIILDCVMEGDSALEKAAAPDS